VEEKSESIGSYEIPEEAVNFGFKHENRKEDISDEQVRENFARVNKIKFS
jgi:hypothetical protein